MAKTDKKASHPWLMAALICNETLEEKDNVLSAIRIVDRFIVQKPQNWDGKSPIPIPLNVLVGFKSGDVRGERRIHIFVVSPNKKRKKLFEATATFLGGDKGVNVRLNVLFAFKSTGTHWIDVYVEKWLATRIPLTIVFGEQANTVHPAVGEVPEGKTSRPSEPPPK